MTTRFLYKAWSGLRLGLVQKLPVKATLEREKQREIDTHIQRERVKKRDAENQSLERNRMQESNRDRQRGERDGRE